MKRLACLLLALGMIFSLCACGKEEIKKEEIKAEDLIGTYVSSHETLYLRSDGTYGECQFNRDQFSPKNMFEFGNWYFSNGILTIETPIETLTYEVKSNGSKYTLIESSGTIFEGQ